MGIFILFPIIVDDKNRVVEQLNRMTGEKKEALEIIENKELNSKIANITEQLVSGNSEKLHS